MCLAYRFWRLAKSVFSCKLSLVAADRHTCRWHIACIRGLRVRTRASTSPSPVVFSSASTLQYFSNFSRNLVPNFRQYTLESQKLPRSQQPGMQIIMK
jgi:hypothetical protein